MVDLSRYAFNGTCFFEDILNQRTFDETFIGSCYYHLCYIKLKKEIVNNREVVYPTIHSFYGITVQYCFKLLKPDGTSGIIEEKRIVLEHSNTVCGLKIELETLEDEGYLETGGLRIQYGFHLVSFRDSYGVRNFNFENPFFNGDYCSVEILNRSESEQFYGQKQILAFHFNTTNDEIIFRNRSRFFINYLLQIAHGVRVQVNTYAFFPSETTSIIAILRCAVHYNLPNVTRIIEMQLMKNKLFFEKEGFEMAVFWNLLHLLALFLKKTAEGFCDF